MPITIDKDIVQFQVPANQRCIQYVSYNSSFEYYTAALSVSAKTIHYVTASFRAKKKKPTDEYRQMLVKKAYTKPTTGNGCLHNENKNNRRKMIQFAISNGLNVTSTTFPHKDTQKETRYSADGRTTSQIDHVSISDRFRTALTDITQLRGPHIESDHNLLKINFKEKLRVKTGNKYNEKRKMVSIFQNPKWKQQYAIEINNRFEILENFDNEDCINNNTNEKWEKH